jgi:tetratricopeptide (TPR) repeat protein
MDMSEEDAATAAFAEIVKRSPTNAPAIKKLAEGHIRAGNYDAALKLYANLSEQDHDTATLENYALLAEALDQHQQLFKAQALAIHKTATPTVEPYLDLAETTTYLADAQPGIQLITQGIAQLPASPALRVAAANLWLLNDSTDQAYAVLHHDCIKDSFDGTSLILSLATTIPDQQGLLSFVGQDIEQRFDLAPATRLDLGILTHLCHDQERSTRLFASVPETLQNLPLLAEAHYNIGELNESIRLLTSHLNDNARALPTDWIFLGDIYEETGREADAQKAYSQSLVLLTNDLPDTVYVAPPVQSTLATASLPR